MQNFSGLSGLGVTTGLQTKSTEKLSSGYKINRAADDAAGLTISEKMRKQIRGLDQASENAQDGVSSVQTAEGAMTEIHSMLQRMNELAVQAANGTNSESDRQAIQDEVTQLTTEIDRVAETTKFNEIYLLKGNADGKTVSKNVNAHDAGLEGELIDNKDGTFTFTPASMNDRDKVSIAGKEYTINSNATSAQDAGTTKDVAAALKNGQANDTATVTPKGGTAATYTYKAEEKWDETKIEAQVTALTGKTEADGTTAGDKIDVGGKVYTYQYQKVTNADALSSLLSVYGASVADDSTITVGSDTYTCSSGAWTKGGTNANMGAVFLSAGQTAVFKDAAGKVLKTVGCAATASNAGYFDGTDELDATAISNIDNTTEVKYTKNGNTTGKPDQTMKDGEQKNPAGWFDANDVELDPETLADGTTVKIERPGTTPTVLNTFTVTSAAADEISAADALDKMKAELEKASSIGTDTAATATVENDGTITIKQGSVSVVDTLAFSLHVGADADMTNKISVDIDSMSCAGLGIKGINLVGKDANGNNINDGGIVATYAIDAIEDAIATVSKQRSALGAVQNRLEHTISNLDNIVENTQSAESRIRDTDMAEEMVEYSKNNILAQAGQSMLAQANQSTQGVLSLLQ